MRRSRFLKNKRLHYNYTDIIFPEKKLECSPPVLVGVAMVATAAAGTTQAYGQIQQGKAQSTMYQYQAALAQQQAAQKRAQAEQVRKQAEEQKRLIEVTAESNITAEQSVAAEESRRLAREVSLLTGAQKATIGALGIGGVTAADIATSAFDKARLDQLAIRYNANVRGWRIGEEARANIWTLGEEAKSRIWALGEEAKVSEVESEQFNLASKYARKTAKIQAATTLLSTAGQVANIGAMNLPKKKVTV